MTSIVKFDEWQNTAGTYTFGKCYAWVNFNGTGTVAIRAALNVTSITDNGTGDYTANFTAALPDGNYSAPITCGQTANSMTTDIGPLAGAAPTATQLRFGTRNSVTGNATDATYVMVAVFR